MTLNLTKLTFVAAMGAAAFIGPISATAQDQTTDIAMVTGTPTGTWFPTGAAFAEFANAKFDGQPISVRPGAGSIGNIMSVGTGEAEMGLSYGAFLKMAQEGNNQINPGEPMPQLRSVLALTPNVLHVLLADDAPIKSLADLSDKPKLHVGTGVPGSTEAFGLELLFGAYDVKFGDLDGWGGSVTRGVTSGRNDGWQNRQFDMVSYMFTPPAANVERLLNNRDGKVVSLSKDIQSMFVDKFGFAPVTIAAGTYPGQDEPIDAVGLPTTLFTTTEVSADIVYEIVKGTAENMERLHQVSANYKRVAPEDLMSNVGIELHEGAQRYYRERGWIE